MSLSSTTLKNDNDGYKEAYKDDEEPFNDIQPPCGMQHHPQPQHSLTTKGIKSLHVADAYEEAYEDGEEPLKHIHPAHRMQHHLERQQSLTTKGIKNQQASPR